MLHGRVVRPPGINATLVSVNGFKKRVDGARQGRRREELPRRRLRARGAGDQGGEGAQGHLERPGRRAELRPAVRADGRADGPGPAARARRRRRQGARGRREGDRGDVLLPVPAARLDGPVVRDRGRAGQRGDGLVADAGRLSAPPGGRRHARHPAAERPRHLQGGLRLLRPERSGHGLAGRRAALQGGRQAGAPAVDARGRARLGAHGHADGDEDQGRARREGQRDRLGLRELAGEPGRPARERRRGEPADRLPHRPHPRRPAPSSRRGCRRQVPTRRTPRRAT